MAITTIDGALAGMQLPRGFYKAGVAMEAAGQWHSHFYAPGLPGAGSAPAPGINGAALSAPLTGTFARSNPSSGNAHVGRLSLTASLAGTFMLCDRLWHNSGLSLTSTSLQSITPATIPSRDRDGATNGSDVWAGLEFSAAGGAGTPTVTLTYTDQDGNTGNTTTFVGVASPNLGTTFIWPLAAGDNGVRAPTGYQQSATWTSGTAHIILFRPIAMIEITAANIGNAIDALTSGMPRIYDNSCLYLMQLASATTATNVTGQLVETHG